MPLDRFLHSVAGHSVKVSTLSHLEFRVWTQYLLSADDFGIMRATPIQFQSDNTALLNVPTRTIQKAIDKLVELGLVALFVNQGQAFLYQRDWQKWQKVGFPRTTKLPLPSDDEQAACDDETRDLFARHPGGKKPNKSATIPGKVSEHSGNDSENIPEQFGKLSRARMTETTATGSGYGSGRGSGVMGGSYLSQTSAAYSGARGVVIPPGRFYSEMLAKFDGDPMAFASWLDGVIARQSEGWKCGDVFKWVREQIDAQFNAQAGSKTAGNIAALQEFVRGGKR
jgi:hypothetical protein